MERKEKLFLSCVCGSRKDYFAISAHFICIRRVMGGVVARRLFLGKAAFVAPSQLNVNFNILA